MGTFAFFDNLAEDPSLFSRKLDLLLTWSVTSLQFGDHRPYAAATLLQLWRDHAEERAIRRDRESPHDLVQDLLFDWLDSSEVAVDLENLPSVALLYGQLVARGLFSFSKYIQRLIARGEQGLSDTEVYIIYCLASLRSAETLCSGPVLSASQLSQMDSPA